MASVNVTIDDKEGAVPGDSTVLEAARLLGVDIPTLCDHPAIEPIGACRMCLVEVQNQRALQPACTFPVSEGMVVATESPKVQDARRFVLQLLFSERNHYCMFCQMSGSCELQDLAYRYGLDHWIFDRPFPKMPVDASRDYFAMDHNRCILCRRCIRACDNLVGNGTLGLKHRGAQTMVIADMDVPFGESSCVSCGTCLQVCPTGALMDRASAYMGATKEITRVKSSCNLCSVGCGVDLVVRGNRVIRVEGDWDAEPNEGLICEIGRFHLLFDKRARVREPLVRGSSGMEVATWEAALGKVASELEAAGAKACTVVSGYTCNETAAALRGLPGDKMLMEPAPDASTTTCLSALDEADVVIVAGTDLTVNHQVAGFAIKRGVRHRGVRLLLLAEGENGIDDWAFRKWAPAEAAKATAIAREAESPVIVYTAGGEALAAELAAAIPEAQRVYLPAGGNTLGLAAAGITTAFQANGATAYYVVAGEAKELAPELRAALEGAHFVAVQASFREPWEGLADVILPSPLLFEKAGTVTTAEGREAHIAAAVQTPLKAEAQVVQELVTLL